MFTSWLSMKTIDLKLRILLGIGGLVFLVGLAIAYWISFRIGLVVELGVLFVIPWLLWHR